MQIEFFEARKCFRNLDNRNLHVEKATSQEENFPFRRKIETRVGRDTRWGQKNAESRYETEGANGMDIVKKWIC